MLFKTFHQLKNPEKVVYKFVHGFKYLALSIKTVFNIDNKMICFLASKSAY